MKKGIVWIVFLLLLNSCGFLSELWSPSDLQQLQTDSKGDITFGQITMDPSIFVGRISQTMVFECHATSDFSIKRVTLDLTSLIGEKLVLPETSSGVWATNMRIYPLSEGDFQFNLVVSNEKGRIVSNTVAVSVKNQNVIYVASYGKDFYEGLKDFPIASINTAISNAIGKSISNIYVAVGVYTNASGGSVLWMNHWTNISLLGGWNSNFTMQQPIISPTVLWGAGRSATIGWINGCSNIVLDGFSVIGGTNTSGNGGGFNIVSSEVALTRILILSNESTNYGGGLYAENSTLSFSNVDFVMNHSFLRGGGAYFRQVLGEINDSRVITNCAHFGGGIFVYNSSSNLTLENMDFMSNYSYPYEGGAVYLDQSEVVITQVNFSYNFANTSGGAIFLNGSSSLIVGNTFSNNLVSSFGYGGAICLQYLSHACIRKNIFDQNNSYNISEYLTGGTETSPAELRDNQFSGMSTLYRDEDGGGVISSLSMLNALDENGYNPSNSVDGNF